MDVEKQDEDFEAVNQQSFNKISQKIEKIGYKDGIHDGRESQFQKGFDIGYENGFKNGFLLGTYKGSISASQTQQQTSESQAPKKDLILERTSRGHCVVCTEQKLMNETISTIVNLQQKQIERIESSLRERYPNVKS